MDKYVCKIATIDEMNDNWNYEIEHASNDKNNWIIWKKENIERFQKGLIIPYYGLLNGITRIQCDTGFYEKSTKTFENTRFLTLRFLHIYIK